jgi:hypothetical protein
MGWGGVIEWGQGGAAVAANAVNMQKILKEQDVEWSYWQTKSSCNCLSASLVHNFFTRCPAHCLLEDEANVIGVATLSASFNEADFIFSNLRSSSSSSPSTKV